MSEPARIPRPIEAVIRSLAGGANEEERDRRASTFARGLAMGALAGAAIAGSTIWQRRAARKLRPAVAVTAPSEGNAQATAEAAPAAAGPDQSTPG